MRRLILLASFVLIAAFAQAQQDTLFNQTDAQGLKQGHWKKMRPDGSLMYKAEFKDGKPIGRMIRYHESGGVSVTMDFQDNSDQVYARMFYEDGEISAEGWFYQMQKDSTWKYYSFYSGSIINEENYSKGQKHGVQKYYYQNGQLSEEVNFKHNIKEGPWIQYFEDGKTKMTTKHSFNQVNGKYTAYYPNGIIMVMGMIMDDKREGKWGFYTDKGELKYEVEYIAGKAQNAETLDQEGQEFLKSIDENIGKFEEPRAEDFFPGGGY